MDTSDRLLKLLIGLAFLAASAALWWPVDAKAVRLKEIAAIQGVRSNQLMGYGLVVGLDGTGDQTTQTPFTAQSLNAMLQQTEYERAYQSMRRDADDDSVESVSDKP